MPTGESNPLHRGNTAVGLWLRCHQGPGSPRRTGQVTASLSSAVETATVSLHSLMTFGVATRLEFPWRAQPITVPPVASQKPARIFELCLLTVGAAVDHGVGVGLVPRIHP